MKTTFKRSISLISLVGWIIGIALPAAAQDPCVSPQETIPFSFEIATLYPSMQPAHYVRVILTSFQVTPFQDDWWRDANNYRLSINGKKVPTPPPTFDLKETSAFLDFHGQELRNGDEIQLLVVLPRTGANSTCAKGEVGANDKATVAGLPRSALTLEPSWVPKQELVNGAKRDVGHLAISVDVKTLSDRTPMRLYVKGDQLISTDGKDKSTKLEAIFGASRSLSRAWLIPIHGEAKMVGDQRVNNASLVLSGGMRTIFPWGWSRGVFWNGIVRAPFSPDIELSAQWERRVRQDAMAQRENPDRTAPRIFTQVSWNAIHLFTGSAYTKDDLSLQIIGKGWLLPNHSELNGATRNRLEGNLQIALVVPVRKFEAVGGISPSGDQAAKQRIRVEFVGGANEANGFQHSQRFSLGFEIIK